MILPTKHLDEARAIVTSGSELLALLNKPRTMNNLWNAVKETRPRRDQMVTYDWFVLSLDFLYSVGAIDLHDGLIWRSNR